MNTDILNGKGFYKAMLLGNRRPACAFLNQKHTFRLSDFRCLPINPHGVRHVLSAVEPSKFKISHQRILQEVTRDMELKGKLSWVQNVLELYRRILHNSLFMTSLKIPNICGWRTFCIKTFSFNSILQ